HIFFFFCMFPRPPRSPLFPYTTLFRSVVVARVQSDRRFVEDIEHTDKSTADLAGQPDALRLAAGQRRGRAVERQVVQADVEQERDRKSTRLNSSHGSISYAVFCLKKTT